MYLGKIQEKFHMYYTFYITEVMLILSGVIMAFCYLENILIQHKVSSQYQEHSRYSIPPFARMQMP